MKKLRVWLKKENRFSYHDLNEFEDVGGLAFILEENMSREEYQFFTGLKDKNGKEIYEGDIIIYGNDEGVEKRQYVIEWKDGMFIGQYEPENDTDYEISFVDCKDNYNQLRSFASFNSVLLEIIGNIYQHKELLTNQLDR